MNEHDVLVQLTKLEAELKAKDQLIQEQAQVLTQISILEKQNEFHHANSSNDNAREKESFETNSILCVEQRRPNKVSKGEQGQLVTSDGDWFAVCKGDWSEQGVDSEEEPQQLTSQTTCGN
eukprot:8190690-Ditylum_brightwellii.AAC.1